MANPQIENGYTKIANEILDALCSIRISGEARQVLDVIFRKTYGFNKKEDRIALSQFVDITKLKKVAVCKAIRKLQDMNLILVTQKDNTGVHEDKTYVINKNYESWKPLPKKVTLPKKVITVTKKGNKPLPKKSTTKDNIQKTITKDIATQGVASQDVVDVIDSFKEVNTSYGKWYSNITQRSAIERTLKIHGKDQVLRVINLLPKTNTIPYLPTVTTPLQLEDKWSALQAGLIKKKTELEAKRPNVIFS